MLFISSMQLFKWSMVGSRDYFENESWVWDKKGWETLVVTGKLFGISWKIVEGVLREKRLKSTVSENAIASSSSLNMSYGTSSCCQLSNN